MGASLSSEVERCLALINGVDALIFTRFEQPLQLAQIALLCRRVQWRPRLIVGDL